ncbi:hypothetical protein DYD21_16400 [Rhodohalobacter sp. SW132]|uniref:YdcF family protein n=1 Tax=Rhodohalobacter sp. SW132 TaxID=2293433 RepID=UPI000E22EAF0|nr:ElyC/SanA/YdcF family protein [Rhodohalobacter sp. SW132]REL24747.1 hypothetical protein DYD21_16400 [Rhodohalobacter sp. SW132]
MIKFLLDPFNILWLFVLTGLVAYLFKKRAIAGAVFIISGGWFLLISTPLVPSFLLNSLEDQYEPVSVAAIADVQAPYHIVVLGGGHGFDDRLPPNSLLSLNALGRLNEGIRLHRQLPNSMLVLSGYSSSGRTTQAEMLRNAAILLGVEEDKLLIQKEPGNTYEEAEVYAERFGTGQPVIVVTSAAHMPRAVIVFEKFGITPLPSPTNYRLKGSWKRKKLSLPALNNIDNLRISLSEHAAIIREKFR